MAIETSKQLHRAAARAEDSTKRVLNALESPTNLLPLRCVHSLARHLINLTNSQLAIASPASKGSIWPQGGA